MLDTVVQLLKREECIHEPSNLELVPSLSISASLTAASTLAVCSVTERENTAAPHITTKVGQVLLQTQTLPVVYY